MTLARDLELLYEIGTVRHISRNWKQFLGVEPANVAEHTIRVTWIALLIAKSEGNANTNKILKMALIHDLSESRTGDANYVQTQFVKRDEDAAIKDILKDTALEEMTMLWQECEEGKTLEAKIVKDADYLDQSIELQELATQGNKAQEQFSKIREVMYNKLSTQTAKALWELIKTSNPFDWHLNSKKNRFTTGDWKLSA